VQELELNQQKVTAENFALNKEVERLRYLEQLRSVPAPAPAAAVPAIKPLLPPNTTGPSRACFRCGVVGHFVKVCPQNPANNEPAALVRGISARNNHEAYLRVRIGGQICDCLLDTGSEVTIFPENIIGNADVMRTNKTLRAANESVIPIIGKVNLTIEIGRYYTQVEGLVSEHIPEPMLGIDFLKGIKAVWDFERGQLWIADQAYELHHRALRNLWCRRVVLEDDVIIPARSEMIVPTKMQFRKMSGGVYEPDWSTESTCVKEGLHVSRTLVPRDVWTDIPVRVMNVKEEPMTLKANTVMSNLQEVEVVSKEEMKNTAKLEVKDVSDKEAVPEYLQKMIDSVDDSIPESTCLALEAILLRYADVFSQDANDLGETNIMMHYIDTGDARPVRQQLRRYPAVHVEAISEHVDNMLKQGTIEPASSPWASNVVLVKMDRFAVVLTIANSTQLRRRMFTLFPELMIVLMLCHLLPCSVPLIYGPATIKSRLHPKIVIRQRSFVLVECIVTAICRLDCAMQT